MKSGKRKWPKPSLVISIVALILALSGLAQAALGQHSVGSRQLQAKAITSSKFAEGAVDGSKVKDGSLNGKDINVAGLETVPAASNAGGAGNASTLGGHSASCGQATIYIRGRCYDAAPSGPVTGVQTAADRCAERGGFLPKPTDLITARGFLNLGDGTGAHSEFTDSYAYNTNGTEPRVIVVNNSGEDNPINEDTQTHKLLATYEYVCVYQLVR